MVYWTNELEMGEDKDEVQKNWEQWKNIFFSQTNLLEIQWRGKVGFNSIPLTLKRTRRMGLWFTASDIDACDREEVQAGIGISTKLALQKF